LVTKKFTQLSIFLSVILKIRAKRNNFSKLVVIFFTIYLWAAFKISDMVLMSKKLQYIFLFRYPQQSGVDGCKW